MQLHEAVKPISYVKAHAAEVIRNVSETGNPLIITQNGEAKAVLMDVREYDAMRESLAMLKILALSSREIEQGKTRDAGDVFSDLSARLRDGRNAKR